MKSVTQFKDEVTGTLFDSAKKAIASEKKHLGIRKMFSWIDDAEKLTRKKSEKDTCGFGNGSWCVQRNKEFSDHLVNTLTEAVYLYEPWVWKEYRKHGGLKPEFVYGMSLLGRYLESSPLSKYLSITSCLCQKCYRQYGQPYYAINCKCNGTSGEKGQYTIETRSIKA